MALGAGRPLLFLDVDGPLIPYGLPPGELPVYPGPGCDDSHPGLARINPEHGRRLAALSCELVWATAWEHEANEWVAPRLGLPRLAVVAWPPVPAAVEERDERLGLHWKTRALVQWAAGRPFAWVDDEMTARDRAWVRAHHRGAALLHRVDPRRGLADGDFEVLAEWLRSAAGLPR
jgi:hypothetical protein